MATPPATPRSSGAGTKSLTHRILHPGFRHSSQDAVPAGDSSGDNIHPQPPAAPSGQPGLGGRMLSWTHFPDAVIKLALSSPAAARPRQEAHTEAPEQASALEHAPDQVPGNTPGLAEDHALEEDPPPAAPTAARTPAGPLSAAKAPPQPERSPAAPAAVPPAPRISGRRTRRRAPFAVNGAALLILAGGTLALVTGLRAAMDPLRPVPLAALQLQDLGVPVESVLTLARIGDAAVTAVAFGLYLLLATLVRDGRNWARSGVCVLVAVALFFGFRDGSFALVATALLAGMGAGLLFLPPSARYFATRGGRTA